MKHVDDFVPYLYEPTPQRLRIAIFVDLFLPLVDGVAIVVHNLATRLSKTADVTVFAPAAPVGSIMPPTPYKIVRCKKITIPLIGYDIAIPYSDAVFCKTLRQSQFDIVHVHSPFSMGRIGVRLAKKHHIPVVATMHSQFKMDFQTRTKSPFLTKLMLRNIMGVFNRCDECWAVNDKMVDVFVGYGAKKAIFVHLNGTDMVPISADKELVDLRTRHHIASGDKVFLFVGRISRLKNIYFILDSLRILADQNFPFKMLYIGSGPETALLEEAIRSQGLEASCEWIGRIDDRRILAEYYQLADLFLFPSLYDASSLVQIEAASQHTPALFLQGAVTAQTVSDGIDGYLSDANPKAYAQKIVSIFADETEYRKVSDGAFQNLYRTWDDEVLESSRDYRRLIVASAYAPSVASPFPL